MYPSSPTRPKRARIDAGTRAATVAAGNKAAVAAAARTGSLLAPRGFQPPGTSAYAGPELKYFDSAVSAVVLASGVAGFHHMTGIAQGDDNNARTGRQITLKSALVRFKYVPNGPVTAAHLLRVMLIWDGFANGAAPTAAEVLKVAGDPLSQNNLDYRARFRVIRDEIIPIARYDTQGGVNLGVCWGDSSIVFKEWYHRFGDKWVTTYKGTTGGLGDTQNGTLYLLMLIDGGGAGTITAQCRVRFTDD